MSVEPTIVVFEDRAQYDRIMNELGMFQNSFVEVGVLENTKRDDGTDMAIIGATHEFGSEKKNIPARSFVRSWVAKNKAAINNLIKSLMIEIIDERIDAKKALNKLGLFGKGGIQQRIIDVKTPPLKPATIKARKFGGSNPLVDEGQLKDSIAFRTHLPGSNRLKAILQFFSKGKSTRKLKS